MLYADQSHVMQSLDMVIPTTWTEGPMQGNKCQLMLMSPPKLLKSFTLRDIRGCYHISCVTPDQVWVSDREQNRILTNSTGVTLHGVDNLCSGSYFYGLHTVNSEKELIYIDRNCDIKKIPKDMITSTTCLQSTDSTWEPRCVYSSPSSGDLLVGMCCFKMQTGKVTRYNQSGQQTQTIQHDETGLALYREPLYITENINGDVVVSDFESGAVVVTECGGRHRFSYTGHPSGSGLWPCGICTDALSHILVCDLKTDTIQMIDKNGHFLSCLLTESQEIGEPWSLTYDANTHHLWVGSWWDNKLCIYKYITNQDDEMTGKSES